MADIVLRQRLCGWGECGRLFFVCRSCWRGQRYCSRGCRIQARRAQCREANRRHQISPEGRLDHRDRQRAYRERRRQGVTDQGRRAERSSARLRQALPAPFRRKGRVERAIRYIRESYFAARDFTTLEDFNAQARRWREQVAHARSWPDDRSRSVREVFQQERSVLTPLPAHPLETDLLTTVWPRKSIYVRFDLNDYSIPPEAVGRPLTLAASDTRVRILEGDRQLALHRRSWDRGQVVADPAHQERLLQLKRKARETAPSDRLAQSVPESSGERAFALDFIAEGRNLILLGPNGVGKTMIVKNLCLAAVQAGHSAIFRTASELLDDQSQHSR